MTFRTGYLTSRESEIWSLRRDQLKQSEIGRRLDISRQAVNQALTVIDSKVERALIEAADANNLQIKSLNSVDGIMEAYSPAYRIPVIVSLSNVNGLKIWYLYEGKCSECTLTMSCKESIIAEVRERGMTLSENDRKLSPTQLALKVFSNLTGGG